MMVRRKSSSAKTPEIRQVVVENVIAALQGTIDLKTALDRAQEQALQLVK
jgi:multiple sugar transport system substrate-binding protein